MIDLRAVVLVAVAAVCVTGCGLFEPRTVVVEKVVQACVPDSSPYSSYVGEIKFQSLGLPQHEVVLRPAASESVDAELEQE